MDKKNLIRLFMFQTVYSFATRQQLITNMVVAYKNGITFLGDLIGRLVALSNSPLIAAGSGTQAEQARTQLNSFTANIISQARGYYLSVHKLDIAEKLDYPYSRLNRISNKTIGGLTEAFMNIITPDVTLLKDWAIAANTLTAWTQLLDQYNREYTLPKDTMETRKQDIKTINALVKQGMDHCRNVLDTSANGFKENGNMDFYKAYKAYRKLTPVASKHGKLKIFVKDDLQQPVSKVTITQDGTTNKISTGADGMATLDIMYNKGMEKNLRDLYTFTISSGSKTSNSGIIVIKRNETVTRVIEMEPTGFIVPAYQNNMQAPAKKKKAMAKQV